LAAGQSKVLAISFLVGVSALVFNIMPILLAAIGKERGYGDAALGDIGSAYFAGFTLVTIFAMVWVRRINWQMSVTFSLLAAAALFIVASYLDGLIWLQISFALLGIAMVFIYTPLMTCLGDTADPDRAMGTSLALQVAVAAGIAFILPAYVLPNFGLRGGLWALAILCTLSLGFVRAVPRSGRFTADGTRWLDSFSALKNAAVGPKVGLVGIFIFYIGITGLWSFLDRVAQGAGLSGDTIGSAISVSLLFGGLGALVPALLGARFGRPKMFLLGFFITIGAVILLATPLTIPRFFLGVILLNIGWNMTVAYAAGQVAQTDNSGYLLPLIPAAISLGAAIAPAISGRVIENSGSGAFFGLMGGIIFVAYAFLFFSAYRSR